MFLVNPEKLKEELIPLTMEERGEFITRKVAQMLSGEFKEDWAYPDKGKTKKIADSPYTEAFELFWKSYHPDRRTGKGAAFKSWKKVAKNRAQEIALLDLCTKALAWQKTSRQWCEGFVPLPATYLNQRRWEDEAPEQKEGYCDINGNWQER